MDAVILVSVRIGFYDSFVMNVSNDLDRKNVLFYKNAKLLQLKVNHIRDRGQWAIYYTSPQRFIITFSYSLVLQLWRL